MRYQYFAPCPRGLEALLAEELAVAGAIDIRQTAGGVEFAGDLACCYRVNLESRIATRVLWRQASGDYSSEDDIYRLARSVDWLRRFSVERSIRIYVTAQRVPLKSLEFVTLRVKDAVCDVFRDACGRRPNVDTKAPDVRIHLFLTEQRATLYLDTSGEPLWQRGHKIAKIEAPLKENLAAGILRLIGWQPGTPLLDPMCGSGTFLLEAAQMSLGDPSGINREPGQFAFERLLSFKPELWRELQKSAVAARLPAAQLPIWGSDRSADAVARAQQNLAHAGLDDLVTVQCADLLTLTAPAPSGVLVCNPPYGERLGELDELAAFYPKLGDALKRRFAGWDCWFLSADTRLPKLIGLKPMRKIPIFNGPLECRIYGFRMVGGSNR
ncbi:MAG: THUMP domain-containing protein [Zoogloeaceae bacterium]|jgi:putative N6-adenine-specific DNA methylase|nr:THUMP domain-containing protein [Zoogloeaceae bacterium]